MYLLAMGLGMLVGKYFFHKFLLCRVLKLRMFSEEGQGSWMVMFLTVLMFLFIISFIYNEFLLLGGAHFAPYVCSNNLGIENQTFMKLAAMGTWLGDFITAWMVTDMMLQVKARCNCTILRATLNLILCSMLLKANASLGASDTEFSLRAL